MVEEPNVVEVEPIVYETIEMDSMPQHEFVDDDVSLYYLKADTNNPERVVVDFGTDLFSSGFRINKDIEFKIEPPVEFSLKKHNSSAVSIQPLTGFSRDSIYGHRC